MLPIRIPATGNVATWQEASVGAESGGLRLTGIKVDVGDTVRRGQVLVIPVAYSCVDDAIERIGTWFPRRAETAAMDNSGSVPGASTATIHCTE